MNALSALDPPPHAPLPLLSAPQLCPMKLRWSRWSRRHSWGSKTYYRQLRIDPLPDASADDLLTSLLGADASLAPLARHRVWPSRYGRFGPTSPAPLPHVLHGGGVRSPENFPWGGLPIMAVMLIRLTPNDTAGRR